MSQCGPSHLVEPLAGDGSPDGNVAIHQLPLAHAM